MSVLTTIHPIQTVWNTHKYTCSLIKIQAKYPAVHGVVWELAVTTTEILESATCNLGLLTLFNVFVNHIESSTNAI